VETRGLLTRC